MVIQYYFAQKIKFDFYAVGFGTRCNGTLRKQYFHCISLAGYFLMKFDSKNQ